MKQWKRVSGVVLSGILALSMTLGGMTAPDAGAKAKKATILPCSFSEILWVSLVASRKNHDIIITL